MADIADVKIQFTADGVNRVVEAINQVSQKLDTIGTAANKAASVWRNALGTAVGFISAQVSGKLVPAFTQAVRAMDDLHIALVRAVGTADNYQQSVARLTNAFMNLQSRGVSVSKDAFAYLAQRWGESASALAGVVEEVADATGLTQEEVAQQLTELSRVFGLTATEAARDARFLAAALMEIGDAPGPFLDTLRELAPVGYMAGLSLKQIIALLTAANEAGIKASNANTALKKLLMVVATGKIEELGIAGLRARKGFEGLVDIVDQLRAKINTLPADKLMQIFGDDAVAGVKRLVEIDLRAKLEALQEGAGRVPAAAADIRQSFAAAWGRFTTVIQGIFSRLADHYLPLFARWLNVAADMLSRFSSTVEQAIRSVFPMIGGLWMYRSGKQIQEKYGQTDEISGAIETIASIIGDTYNFNEEIAKLLSRITGKPIYEEVVATSLANTMQAKGFLSPNDIKNQLDRLDRVNTVFLQLRSFLDRIVATITGILSRIGFMPFQRELGAISTGATLTAGARSFTAGHIRSMRQRPEVEGWEWFRQYNRELAAENLAAAQALGRMISKVLRGIIGKAIAFVGKFLGAVGIVLFALEIAKLLYSLLRDYFLGGIKQTADKIAAEAVKVDTFSQVSEAVTSQLDTLANLAANAGIIQSADNFARLERQVTEFNQAVGVQVFGLDQATKQIIINAQALDQVKQQKKTEVMSAYEKTLHELNKAQEQLYENTFTAWNTFKARIFHIWKGTDALKEDIAPAMQQIEERRKAVLEERKRKLEEIEAIEKRIAEERAAAAARLEERLSSIRRETQGRLDEAAFEASIPSALAREIRRINQYYDEQIEKNKDLFNTIAALNAARAQEIALIQKRFAAEEARKKEEERKTAVESIRDEITRINRQFTAAAPLVGKAAQEAAEKAEKEYDLEKKIRELREKGVGENLIREYLTALSNKAWMEARIRREMEAASELGGMRRALLGTFNPFAALGVGARDHLMVIAKESKLSREELKRIREKIEVPRFK